jgi:hypothetical protein
VADQQGGLQADVGVGAAASDFEPGKIVVVVVGTGAPSWLED